MNNQDDNNDAHGQSVSIWNPSTIKVKPQDKIQIRMSHSHHPNLCKEYQDQYITNHHLIVTGQYDSNLNKQVSANEEKVNRLDMYYTLNKITRTEDEAF